LQGESEKFSTSIGFSGDVSGVAEAYNAIVDKARTPCPTLVTRDKVTSSPHATDIKEKSEIWGHSHCFKLLKSYHERWIPNCRKTHSHELYIKGQ